MSLIGRIFVILFGLLAASLVAGAILPAGRWTRAW
jgi:hypothetical protein